MKLAACRGRCVSVSVALNWSCCRAAKSGCPPAWRCAERARRNQQRAGAAHRDITTEEQRARARLGESGARMDSVNGSLHVSFAPPLHIPDGVGREGREVVAGVVDYVRATVHRDIAGQFQSVGIRPTVSKTKPVAGLLPWSVTEASVLLARFMDTVTLAACHDILVIDVVISFVRGHFLVACPVPELVAKLSSAVGVSCLRPAVLIAGPVGWWFARSRPGSAP